MLLLFRIDANNDQAEHRAAELFASRSSDHPGRTPVSTLQKYVIAGRPARVAKHLSELAAVGCGLFVMHALEGGRAGRDQLEALVSDVIPLVR